MHTKTILYLDRIRDYGFEGDPLTGEVHFFTRRDRSDWGQASFPVVDELSFCGIVDRYLLHYAADRFDTWYPGLLLAALSLRQHDPRYFELITERLRLMLSEEQCFTLGIFGLTEMLPQQLQLHHSAWPTYAYIRYLILQVRQNLLSIPRLRIIVDRLQLTAAELMAEIAAIPWNPILSPCQIQDEYGHPYDYPIGFINDLNFLAQYGLFKGTRQVATHFFTVFPQRQDLQLRLWLYGYVSRSFFDHRQFRAPLMQLTYYEKKLFYRHAHSASQRLLDRRALDLLASCEAVFLPNGDQQYHPTPDQLFFRTGQLCLKSSLGYFLYHNDERLRPALNTLARNLPMKNSLPSLVITCRDDDIIHIDGLEALIDFLSDYMADMVDFATNNLDLYRQNSTLLPQPEHKKHRSGPAELPPTALLRGLNEALKQILHH
jgi:hypothetical protein